MPTKMALPEPVFLYMCAMPMTLGGDSLTYAPVTVGSSRDNCWSRTLAWANEAHKNAELFHRICTQKKTHIKTTAQTRRHMALWARYRPDALRKSRIAWLKRRGCRVVAGRFVAEQEANHESA
jgi:hypothetical protein